MYRKQSTALHSGPRSKQVFVVSEWSSMNEKDVKTKKKRNIFLGRQTSICDSFDHFILIDSSHKTLAMIGRTCNDPRPNTQKVTIQAAACSSQSTMICQKMKAGCSNFDDCIAILSLGSYSYLMNFCLSPCKFVLYCSSSSG